MPLKHLVTYCATMRTAIYLHSKHQPNINFGKYSLLQKSYGPIGRITLPQSSYFSNLCDSSRTMFSRAMLLHLRKTNDVIVTPVQMQSLFSSYNCCGVRAYHSRQHFAGRRPAYIIVGVLLLGVAVLVMYVPRKVPEWAEERRLLQFYISGMFMSGLAARGLSVVTKQTEVQALRSLTDIAYSGLPAESQGIKMERTSFDGVPVEIYRPQPGQDKSPAIVYIHGGGWTLLSTAAYRATTNHMALEYNTVVMSIEYRLAPEHPYPVPFQDCLKATVHFLRNAEKFGVDPNRIAIAGDSAGGNLAAAVALRLSQEDLASKLPRLKFQILIYPALQMMDFNTYSYKTFSETNLLTKQIMLSMWLNYLGYPELREQAAEFAVNNHTSPALKQSLHGTYLKHENLPKEVRDNNFQPVGMENGNKALSDKIQSRILDPYFAPLMAPDLSQVPKAYFIIAQNDVLRDDGLLYRERLRKAGVETEMDFYRGMGHGFCLLSPFEMFTYKGGIKALDNVGKFVKENL